MNRIHWSVAAGPMVGWDTWDSLALVALAASLATAKPKCEIKFADFQSAGADLFFWSELEFRTRIGDEETFIAVEVADLMKSKHKFSVEDQIQVKCKNAGKEHFLELLRRLQKLQTSISNSWGDARTTEHGSVKIHSDAAKINNLKTELADPSTRHQTGTLQTFPIINNFFSPQRCSSFIVQENIECFPSDQCGDSSYQEQEESWVERMSHVANITSQNIL